jgi:DNA-binding SARP family transcriptional activator
MIRWKRKCRTNPEAAPSTKDADLDARVRRSHERLRHAQADKPRVDSLAARLRRHFEENSFGERLYEQMMTSRREP